jgi:hypothetical protein
VSKTYYGLLSFLETKPSATLLAIAAGFVTYFALLAHQVRAFDGSLRTADFLTAQTVVPWCLYSIAGFVAAPFLIQQLIRGASKEPEGNGPAVVAALLIGVWLLLPWLVLQCASFYPEP